MARQKNTSHKVIMIIIAGLLLLMGILLFFIPPALFPDPGMGFQVLRSMQLGSPFNTFSAPDQSDISQNYAEYLTWWSPGQYLIPYFFKLGFHFNTGRAIAATVTICGALGLTGFYYFFRRTGFTSFTSALSLVFIICQQAFVVPYVFYNGGEVLIFAFEGWFLFGCISLKRPGARLVLFVILSGWAGFFLKSSFIWMYIAGLLVLWISLSSNKKSISDWVKNGASIALPGVASLVCIYIFFLSKGHNPASVPGGLKINAAAFCFPLGSPLLSAFSIDDFFHGLLFHTGMQYLNPLTSLLLILIAAVLSVVLIVSLAGHIPNFAYKTVLITFYVTGCIFFIVAYLRQLNISYEARHFRLLGILVVPGMLHLLSGLKPRYQWLFTLVVAGIALTSYTYLLKGYIINQSSAKGITGISQPDIDQTSLNQVMKLDRQNHNAVFVFMDNSIGLEVLHNRTIALQPVSNNLQINLEDYRYDGFAGPLYIVLPESYNGPKEKLVIKSFPGYAGFNLSMLSNNYVLYSAAQKK